MSAVCVVDGPGDVLVSDGAGDDAGDGSGELSGEKSSYLSACKIFFNFYSTFMYYFYNFTLLSLKRVKLLI